MKFMPQEAEEEKEEAEKPGHSSKEKSDYDDDDRAEAKAEAEGRAHGGGIHKGPKHHSIHKRKKGGVLPLDGAKEHKTEALNHHHHGRKSGGHVPGKMAEHRPDRRARGGGVTADLHPETAAGRVSTPAYLTQQPYVNDGGRGPDKKVSGGRRLSRD